MKKLAGETETGVESILKLPNKRHCDISSKTHPPSSRNVSYVGRMRYLQQSQKTT